MIVKRFVAILPWWMVDFLTKLVRKITPTRRMWIERIRLDKFVERTDFTSLDTSGFKPCRICQGTWDYKLLNMCFLWNALDLIIYCLSRKWIPYVDIKNSKEKINIWNELFLQPFDSSPEEIDIYCDLVDGMITWPLFPNAEDVKKYSPIYKTFVCLNEETKKYIEEEYGKILKGKRVLGVLCRGTDYTANRPSGHPIQPSIDEVVKLVKIKMAELKCDYIYLATEEKVVFDRLDKEFPKKVLENKRMYYDDFYRIKQEGGEETRISWVTFERERDSYYKSLEYFSSLMLLAKCSALIAGNCGGSRTALFLNDNKYEYSYLFDLGVY